MSEPDAIPVTGCLDCPFESDEWALCCHPFSPDADNVSTAEARDGRGPWSPEWCPLRKAPALVSLRRKPAPAEVFVPPGGARVTGAVAFSADGPLPCAAEVDDEGRVSARIVESAPVFGYALADSVPDGEGQHRVEVSVDLGPGIPTERLAHACGCALTIRGHVVQRIEHCPIAKRIHTDAIFEDVCGFVRNEAVNYRTPEHLAAGFGRDEETGS